MDCKNLIEYIISKLKNGDIPETNLNIYFYDCKSEATIIKKTINTLNNYYSNASLNEKYLLNNLLFILESLSNKKQALINFIKRTLDFNIYEAYKNKEAKKAINFIVYENYNEDDTFEAIKEILNNPSFYQIKNILPLIWSNKNFYNNKKWLNLFEDMTNALYKLIKKEDITKVMPLHFVIYHTYGNNIQTIEEWKNFNQKVEIPASKFYHKIGKNLNLPKIKKRISNKKKKIGFIFDRLVLNSPFMVMYSLIKKLSQISKEYEIYIYSLNYCDKDPEEQRIINALYPYVNKIFSHNFENVYYDHLKKAIEIREEIIKDKIDYLITMASGYDINNFLITNRSAPKQIFWSHGNCAFDIPNIDKKISHFEQECKEFKWEIFNVNMAEEFLIGSEESKQKAKILKETLLNQFGKKTIFLGTIGRLIKLESEEYLKVISEIMKQNPNTVYLACGSGNQKKVEKLMKEVGIDLKRVVFTGQVDPHMFGWIIDIWLNTYPLPQGISQEEYHEKGHGIVIQSKHIINCKYDYEFIEKEILEEKPEVFFKAFEIENKNINKNISFNKLMFEVYKKHNKNINEKEILQCIAQIENLPNCKEKWLQTINCICQNKEYREMYRWMTYRLWQEHKKWKNSKNEFLDILKD